jgi:NDP-sugar pyrophosphorylase family protein
MSDFDTFIFCAGHGTRLKPYTDSVPKPLLELGVDSFILMEIIKKLKPLGIDEVIVNYSYGKAYFEEARRKLANKLGVNLVLVKEEEPLGHLGGLRNAFDTFATGKVFALNGDTIPDVNEKDVNMLMEICTQSSPLVIFGFDNSENNILKIDDDKNLISVGERQFINRDIKDSFDATGIYMINKDVIRTFPKNEFLGFYGENDLVEELISRGKNCQVYVPKRSLNRISIGTREEYELILKENYND